METLKKTGVWLDSVSAHIVDFKADGVETKIIESAFTSNEKHSSLEKNENLMHNKERHMASEYYKSIIENIRDSNELVLFGPSQAKSELHNLMKDDHRFANIKIESQTADKMNDREIRSFVQDHFAKV